MIPYYLEVSNFMCYRGEPRRLDFDGLHVACLSGENGAGKSALLDAITWALWGTARTSDDDLIAQGEREMHVEFGFMLNEQLYRVSRRREQGRTTRSGKVTSGRGTVEFQIQQGGGWKTISEGSIPETNRAIRDTLGMSYDTFINTSFLMQGRADEFTRKTPAERKAVLGDMLELAIYEQLASRARETARDLKSSVQALNGLIVERQRDADRLPETERLVQAAEARLATAEADLKDAEQRLHATRQQQLLLHELQQQQQALLARIAEDETQQQACQQQIATLEQRIAEDEARLTQRDTIVAGLAELATARATVATLDQLQPEYEQLQEQRHELQDQLKDARRALQVEQQRVQHIIESLQQQLAQEASLHARLTETQQQLAALEQHATRRTNLQQQIAVIRERERNVRPLLRQYDQHQQAIQQAQRDLTSRQQELQRTIQRLTQELAGDANLAQELAAARAAAQRTADLTATRDDLHQQRQTRHTRLTEQRAILEQFKQQADQLKQWQQTLHDANSTTCPLCQSELGTHGMQRVHQHYDTEIENLRREYASYQQQIKQGQHELDQLEQQLAGVQRELDTATRAAARIEHLEHRAAQQHERQQQQAAAQHELEQVSRQISDATYAPDARAALQHVTAQLANLLDDPADPHAAAEQLAQQHASLEQDLIAIEQQLAHQSSLQAEQTNTRQHLAQIAQAARELPTHQAELARIAAQIEQGDYAHEIRQQGRSVEAALAALGYDPQAHRDARQHVEQLAHWEQQQHELQMAEQRVQSNREALATQTNLLARIAQQLQQQHATAADYRTRLLELPAVAQQVQQGEAAVIQATSQRDDATRQLIEARSLHERARLACAEVQQRTTERDQKAARQSLFDELGQAFGKSGVQALLIETAVPEIEREANRLLSRMTGNQMHVSFEMQRTTKQGKLSETLDIKIADALGTRTYDAFSGGEAMRINFAIRIALSRLLAGRAGARLETLIIDEGFGALDADGRERFIEAITSVQEDFKRILVITHIDELKDRFPARIEITRTALGSEWAVV